MFLTATAVDLKNSIAVSVNDRIKMGDHRFKGYVNDFMFSPRNPITMHSSNQMAG